MRKARSAKAMAAKRRLVRERIFLFSSTKRLRQLPLKPRKNWTANICVFRNIITATCHGGDDDDADEPLLLLLLLLFIAPHFCLQTAIVTQKQT